MHVRTASLDEVDLVLDILGEAAEWMATRGYANWPDRFSRRLIERTTTAGEVFVVEIDDAVVATLTLQWSDPFFWGDAGDDGTAAYVHRLAVRRAHAGHGLGYRLLEWADAQIRARARSQLRLDVVSDNGPLRRYYEIAGFAYLRDVEGDYVTSDGTEQHWRTSLYERAVD